MDSADAVRKVSSSCTSRQQRSAHLLDARYGIDLLCSGVSFHVYSFEFVFPGLDVLLQNVTIGEGGLRQEFLTDLGGLIEPGDP